MDDCDETGFGRRIDVLIHQAQHNNEIEYVLPLQVEELKIIS
jgi:hypothetical protein